MSSPTVEVLSVSMLPLLLDRHSYLFDFLIPHIMWETALLIKYPRRQSQVIEGEIRMNSEKEVGLKSENKR